MLKLTAKKKKTYSLSQDPSGETTVTILHLKPGEVLEIEEKANQVTGKQYGEEFGVEVGFKGSIRRREILRRVIVDWKGFADKNGKSLPCSDPNKLLVAKEWDWFFDQIEEFREDLKQEFEAEQEGADPNSESSVSG